MPVVTTHHSSSLTSRISQESINTTDTHSLSRSMVTSENQYADILAGSIAGNAFGINGESDYPIAQKLAGIEVKLYQSDGQLLRTVLTDAEGRYQFDGLAIGQYKLHFESIQNAALYIPIPNSVDGNSDIDNGGFTSVVSVSAGEVLDHIDANFLMNDAINIFARVGSKVWLDSDRDGLQDLNESGVAGVCVSALNALGELVATVETNQYGEYLFETLAAGQYQFKFDFEKKLKATVANIGHSDAADSDINASGLTPLMFLNAGEVRYDIDAGLISNRNVPEKQSALPRMSEILSDDSRLNAVLATASGESIDSSGNTPSSIDSSASQLQLAHLFDQAALLVNA